jgi:hypothetical protein
MSEEVGENKEVKEVKEVIASLRELKDNSLLAEIKGRIIVL